MDFHEHTRSLRGIIESVKDELAHLGAGALSTVDTAKLLEVADAAFHKGGLSAVLPGLVDQIDEWVKNPVEAKLIAFSLRMAEEWLAHATLNAEPEVTPNHD